MAADGLATRLSLSLFPDMEIRHADPPKKSLSEYRRRLKRRGVVRLEVHVRKEDASLVRSVVTALSDPSRESETRAMLQERFGGSKAAGLKALLVSAPLEGIDLSRQRDFGREPSCELSDRYQHYLRGPKGRAVR
jgi:hypothetical protein